MKYLESLIVNRAPETVRVLKSLCENNFECYENKNIDFLFNEWKNKELKSATIKKLLIIYKAWYRENSNKEINLKYYLSNLDRHDKKEIKVWTKEQARKALDFCKIWNYKAYLAILIGLHTGVRPGEALGLRWEDINFNSKKMWVRRSKNNPIKNGVSRSIKMTDELMTTLEFWKNLNLPNESDLVIPNYDFSTLFKFISRSTGVPLITYHKLRHSFASMGLDAGVSVKEISKILGHKQVSTTLNLYWQSTKEIDIDFAP